MRPVKTQQSGFLHPLNRILGAEANVRLLRVLASAREPLSRAEAARRAQLDPSGVRRPLELLAAEGIVEPVGAGARPLVRLRDAHPLAGAVRELFAAERARADDLARAVREAAERLDPPISALWMVPPEEEKGALGTLRVGALAGARDVDRVARELRTALTDAERRFDVPIEVRAWTAADLRTLDAAGRRALAGARPLIGLAPAHLTGEAPSGEARGPWRSHAELDRRSLALARAIGDRVVRDPALIERARGYVDERIARGGPAEQKEMEEWRLILITMSPHRLRAFLGDPGERATRLRQSLPFTGVLSPAERERLLREAEGDAQPA